MNKFKSLFTVFSILAMALVFTHCKDEKQSELSLDSFEQFVTISGKVVYSTGVDTTSTDYTMEVLKPAAGRKVFVEVGYADYKPGSAGTKIFETETDSIGAFSIEIPTTPLGLPTAAIRMEEFTDFYSEYVKMEDGKPVFKTRLRRYELIFPALPSTLKSGAFSFPEALAYGSTEIDMEGYEERLTLTGNVQLAYESSYRIGAYRPASSETVELEVTYDPLAVPPATPLTVTYGTSTDANGNYSITIPLKSFKDGLQIDKVSIRGIGQTEYTHYFKPGRTKKLSGAYATNNLAGFPINLTNIVEDIPHSLGQQFLKFTPGHNDGLPQAEFAPGSWTDDLAGWEKYPGFGEKVTITGTCKMAAETGFATGSYKTGVQTVKLNITAYGTLAPKTVYAATKADGSFSIDLPAEKSTDAYTIALLVPEETEFLHYRSATDSITIGGTYYEYENIKKEAALWNELGDYYYKFTPDNKPKTWHDDLAGWVKIEDRNLTATVSGKVYLAKETAFAAGTYAPATGQVIGIVDGDGNTYEGVVGGDGTLNIEVPVERSTDELTIGLATATIDDIKDFVHYTKGGTEDVRTLAGQYDATQLKSASAKWNELGDIYYEFTPDGTPPATWQKDLAGWKVALNHKFSKPITGTVKFPVENAFRVGSYKGAAYQIVKLASNGFTLVGATDANGAFSIPVPLQYEDDEPGAAWDVSMNSVETTSYIHFRKPGSSSTETLEGDYNLNLDDVPLGSPWNELGTRYYDFAPDGVPTNWSNDLPGWVVLPNQTATITIKAKVKKAFQKKEGGVWIAGWEADKNRMATVQVSGTDYDVVSNSAGDIQFTLPVNGVPATQIITITPDNDASNVTFTHHPDNTSDNRITIYGKFGSAGNITNETITKDATVNTYNVTESAKMYFTPDGAVPDGWAGYDWTAIVDQE
jgi:hypothetical protein